MIPRKLTIKGIYSYQQETTIDFGPLTDAGLFGIFGPVGSGKSTILEAIMFALYGETERLNSRDGRGYNMMNLRSNELLIDFTFSCGPESDLYRFTVGSKRNKKKFQETSAFERKSYQWIQDNWVPVATSAADILGLSYDNFKRTVIIPQGRFQEFLQLKESEKIQMLKEIFNLEKYELGPKVSDLSRSNDLDIKQLEGQLMQIPVAAEEAMQAMQQRRKETEMLIAQLTAAIVSMNEAEKMQTLLRQLFADATEKNARFEKLKQDESTYLTMESELQTYERCVAVFGRILDEKASTLTALQKQKKQLTSLLQQRDELAGTISRLQSKQTALKTDYDTRDILLQKAGEIEKLLQMLALRHEHEQLQMRITKGLVLIQEKEAVATGLHQQIADVRQSISENEANLPDTAQLYALKDWFGKKKLLQEQRQRTADEQLMLTSRLSKNEETIRQQLATYGESIATAAIAGQMPFIQQFFSEKAMQANNEIESLQSQLEHLTLTQKLKDFADALFEGNPCPLCGSVHHPKPLSSTDVETEVKSLRRSVKDEEQLLAEQQRIQVNLSAIFSELKTTQTQLAEAVERLNRQQQELEEHNAGFSFKGYEDEDEHSVVGRIKAMEELNALIAQLRKTHTAKEAELAEAQANVTRFKEGIEKLREEAAKVSGQMTLLQSQLHTVNEDAMQLKTETELREEIAALTSRHREITSNFESTVAMLQAQQSKWSTLDGSVQTATTLLDDVEKKWQGLEQNIKQIVTAEGYNTEEQVLQILQSKLDVQQQRLAINAYRQQLHTLHEQLKEANEKIAGKSYGEAQHDELKQAIASLTEQLGTNQKDLITLSNAITKAEQDQQQRSILEKKLEKLNERSVNLKTLSNLFRGSGFVSYVSTVYLQNLINMANNRFYRMTRQALRLELSTDSNFQVRDFSNNGELRSIKTLSGGQLFQAALCMALALADNIQQLTKSNENFFFLDEGFGTLDKESLGVVYETLRGLKKENRIVGIISHVEEMQQEISINLRISNDLERGSIVSTSWQTR